MKKIFITGISGFIGFHLAKALKTRGDKVFGLDNFNPYYDISLKKNRASLLKDLEIDIFEGDLVDKPLLEDLIKTHKPTHIVNLAAQAGVRYSLVNPDSYMQSNLIGFLNILECLKNLNHIPLIYASSSSVYGLNTKSPFSESDKTDKPANLYGTTKKTNELLAFSYHSLFNLKVTGLRYFTVYGPWGRPDMAYFSFTKNILEEKPIDVFNNGKMERDFTYIDDAVNGTIRAIDKSYPCEVFNIGSHTPVPLLDFIYEIETLLGKKAIKNLIEKPPGDILTTFADTQYSLDKLGYIPKTSLKEGLKKFIDWYLAS